MYIASQDTKLNLTDEITTYTAALCICQFQSKKDVCVLQCKRPPIDWTFQKHCLILPTKVFDLFFQSESLTKTIHFYYSFIYMYRLKHVHPRHIAASPSGGRPDPPSPPTHTHYFLAENIFLKITYLKGV